MNKNILKALMLALNLQLYERGVVNDFVYRSARENTNNKCKYT